MSAQAATPVDDRARALVAKTASGQEHDVPCSELDEPLGRALLAIKQQARSDSYERLAIAVRLAERAGQCSASDALVGAALNDLSDVQLGLAQVDQSIATAQESVEIHRRLHDDVGEAEAWNRIGNAEFWRDHWQLAFDAFHRALDLSTGAHDRAGQGRAWNNLGNLHKNRGQFEKAFEYLTNALHCFEELGDTRRAAVVTNNIGILYFNRGEYATALEYNGRAMAMNRATDNQARLGASFDSAGNIYLALGSYRRALESFQQALALRRLVGDKAGIMETTHNIGLVHFSLGDYELAIEAYRHALRLNPDVRDESFVAEALQNIGAAAWRLGQHERAAADLRQGLAIAHRLQMRGLEAELLNELGLMTRAAGQPQRALQWFNEALDLRTSIGDQAGITQTLTEVASARLADRHYREALGLGERAVANAQAHDQPELLWRAQTVIGAAHRRLRQTAEAREALNTALQSVEQLSTRVFGSENLRQHFLEDKLSPYHELVALSVADRGFDQALLVAERSKARVLAQLIGGHHVDDRAILTSEERHERSRLRDGVSTLNAQLDQEEGKKVPDRSRLDALESSRRSARDELAAFEAALPTKHPELAAVRGEVQPLTVADLGTLVPDRTSAVVEYVVTERQLFAFLLTRDGDRVAVDGHVSDISAAEISAHAERFRNHIAARDLDIAIEAKALYASLLGPFERRLADRTRLIVVPDAALWNVPFQALLGPQGYVIEHTAISYAPSLAVLRQIEGLSKPAGARTVLIMGRSQFGPPSSASLGALPDAEHQVQLIRNIYGPSRSAVYSGDEATETQFRAVAPRYSVLHIATHGVLDEASPLYSYLALSPAGHGVDDDGRLEAWEIMRLKLTADVVVLAACDTGRGRIAPGEGVIGTMWALFAAGARSMVVSQFAVESKSATGLLVGFHRRLADGRGSKAEQLRAATVELMHTSGFAHPYYWAGFILVGSSE